MQVVIDSSAILAVLLGEAHREALIRATAEVSLLAPASTPWEIGNALVAGWRRKRLSRAQMLGAWDSFQGIPLRLVEVDVPAALAIAASQGTYAYDAYVLEAAQARRLPLLTLDKRLARAAGAVGLDVVEV
jgi:predicted nucleic acid-binding protein